MKNVFNTDNILYEDTHLLAVAKQAGQLTQGDQIGATPLSDMLTRYLITKRDVAKEVFLGVVHRLDQPVSGVLLFAKTPQALAQLNAQFAAGDTKKVYWALVKNKPPQQFDILTHWLVRNPKQNKSYCYNQEVRKSKRAVLEYAILKELHRYFWLEIRLHTGRHHQIRCQLAAIGCPIKGDLKYGFERSNANGGIYLHARRLSFLHPVTGESVSIEAPLPNDTLWSYCNKAEIA